MESRAESKTVRCRVLQGGYKDFPAGEVRFRPAVYGIAVEDGRVLLGRSAFTGLWDIPGGAVETWETLEEGLQREFREETGAEIEVLSLVHFSENFFSFFNRAFHSLRFYYRVRRRDGRPLVPQVREVTELHWVDIRECPETEFPPEDLEILRGILQDSQE